MFLMMHFYELNCKFVICLSWGVAHSCTTWRAGNDSEYHCSFLPMGGISYFELSFVEQLTCLACLSRCSSNPQRRKRPPAFNSIPNSSFQVSVQAYVHEDKTAFQYMVITITFTNTKGWSLKYFLSLSSIHFIIIILDSF